MQIAVGLNKAFLRRIFGFGSIRQVKISQSKCSLLVQSNEFDPGFVVTLDGTQN